MAKYYYTSDEIIKSVKRRIVIPTSQNLFTDQDLLDFATEEMNMAMVPMVNTQQEDYYLFKVDIPIELGKTKYAIPYRATGNKLKDVAYIPDLNSTQVCEMTRIDLGDLPGYLNYGSPTSSQIYTYYVANNEICLVTHNNPATGYLRMYFYIRPNSLVPLEEVGIITAIDTVNGIVTLSEVPEKFTTAEQYDFVMVKSPHKILTYDNTATLVDLGTKQVTFGAGNLPEGLVIGDHVCLSTECAIPQIPSDLHVMLAHRVAARVLEAIGDTEALQNANQKLGEMEKRAADLIDNRVETASRKIVNRNGLLRGGISAYKRRGHR